MHNEEGVCTVRTDPSGRAWADICVEFDLNDEGRKAIADKLTELGQEIQPEDGERVECTHTAPVFCCADCGCPLENHGDQGCEECDCMAHALVPKPICTASAWPGPDEACQYCGHPCYVHGASGCFRCRVATEDAKPEPRIINAPYRVTYAITGGVAFQVDVCGSANVEAIDGKLVITHRDGPVLGIMKVDTFPQRGEDTDDAAHASD